MNRTVELHIETSPGAIPSDGIIMNALRNGLSHNMTWCDENQKEQSARFLILEVYDFEQTIAELANNADCVTAVANALRPQITDLGLKYLSDAEIAVLARTALKTVCESIFTAKAKDDQPV